MLTGTYAHGNAPLKHSPALALVFLLAVLGGCAVGPDFVPPEAPKATRYTEHPLPEQTAGTDRITGGSAPDTSPGASPGAATAAQRFVPGALPERWWNLFANSEINALVERALVASPDLARAGAILTQARELWRAQAGVLLSPAVDLSASAVPQQINTAGMGAPPGLPRPTPFTLYSVGLSASYSFDFFGAERRVLEALGAEVLYRQFELEAARLSLASNVVACAVRDAGTRALIKATSRMIDVRTSQLAIAESQIRAGGESALGVSARRRDLAELTATLPPLERALAANRHQLAVLVGGVPSESRLPTFDLRDFSLPDSLPVSLPGELVRQRPDIRAAEALLHKATAEAGVAAANLYPRLTLVGSAGYNANHRNELFLDSASVWSLGTSLLQPLFRGGELRARKRAAEAGLGAALAAWKQSVLQGYADVATALAALESGAKTLVAVREASGEAEAAYAVVKQQHALGAVSLLDLLEAERRAGQASLARIQAEMDRFFQTVTLFQALGGGWSLQKGTMP